MVDRIKSAIEPLYRDICSVYEKETVYKNGRTEFAEKLVYENVPCRVSAKAYLFGEKAGSEKDNTLKVTKRAKLFVPPECVIKPGSRIKVVSSGREEIYGKSGQMNSYKTHNEVMVEILKDYA